MSHAGVNNEVVGPDDFLVHRGRPEGRGPQPIHCRDRAPPGRARHAPVFGTRLSYRRILEVQARLLARVLTGELESYPEYRVR